MKRSLPHGSLDVPDQWTDMSVYQFAAPPRDDLAVPFMAGKAQVRPPAAAVAVARMTLLAGQTLEQLIVDVVAALPGHEPIDEPPWRHPLLGDVRVLGLHARDTGSAAVRMAICFVPWTTADGTVTTLTFSSDATSWELHVPAFRRAFESFRLP